MHTQRLVSLASPAHIERLLDSYVWESGGVSATARKLATANTLPAHLRRSAARAMMRGYVCSVWSDGITHWLFAGGLVLDRAREIGRPVLEVHCFDSERESRSVLTAKLPDGTWCHYAD